MRIKEWKAHRQQLRSWLRMMDSEASFDTEEGRSYARLLLKLVMVEMKIEALEKEKIART